MSSQRQLIVPHGRSGFELLREHVRVVALGQPPRRLSSNVVLSSSREANTSILQRDRRSRRITSAATRPGLDVFVRILQSLIERGPAVLVEQAPGSSGSSSTFLSVVVTVLP
jgi:hypothetical protein